MSVRIATENIGCEILTKNQISPTKLSLKIREFEVLILSLYLLGQLRIFCYKL